MRELLNQHSYLLVAAVVLALALVPVLGVRGYLLRVGIVAAVVGLLVVGYIVLRTGTSSYATTDAVDSVLRGGTPTLLEFYSDY